MKNPAVNFYTSDFLTGTTFMSNEQVGAYIRLLSYQHQLGHLTKEQVFSITKDDVVLSKFKTDKKGFYFNERMEIEITKKKKYSESRARNRSNSNKKTNKKDKTYEKDMKNICNSYEEHMENENINKNINKKNIKKDKSVREEKKEEKLSYAEFVNMSKTEYQKLINSYGEKFTQECINTLDNYKGSSGKKYKSDYRAILSWVVNEVKKRVKVEPQESNEPTWFNKNIEEKELSDERKREIEEIERGT